MSGFGRRRVLDVELRGICERRSMSSMMKSERMGQECEKKNVPVFKKKIMRRIKALFSLHQSLAGDTKYDTAESLGGKTHTEEFAELWDSPLGESFSFLRQPIEPMNSIVVGVVVAGCAGRRPLRRLSRQCSISRCRRPVSLFAPLAPAASPRRLHPWYAAANSATTHASLPTNGRRIFQRRVPFQSISCIHITPCNPVGRCGQV